MERAAEGDKQQPTQSSVSQPEAEGPTLGWLLHRERGEGGGRGSNLEPGIFCCMRAYRNIDSPVVPGGKPPGGDRKTRVGEGT